MQNPSVVEDHALPFLYLVFKQIVWVFNAISESLERSEDARKFVILVCGGSEMIGLEWR
jgi:hypothetical protein